MQVINVTPPAGGVGVDTIHATGTVNGAGILTDAGDMHGIGTVHENDARSDHIAVEVPAWDTGASSLVPLEEDPLAERSSRRSGARNMSTVSPLGRRLKALASIANRSSFRGDGVTAASLTAVGQLARQDGSEYSTSDLVLVKRLGEGAFATVQLATVQSANGGDGSRLQVAVKRMKTKIRGPPMPHSETPTFVAPPPFWHAYFLAEVVMMKQFNHPNVVACYGIVQDDDYSFVQEYCGGGNLLDRVRKPSSYTMSDALRWLLDVARGMEYLHRPRAGMRLAHRDLKLENVLLSSKDGNAKVGHTNIHEGVHTRTRTGMHPHTHARIGGGLWALEAAGRAER